MGTVIRNNERSWAIEVITQINIMLENMNIRIKRAGGESTLSVNKKSMFPDVLLYADLARTKILQGWEIKMPDVLITDETFVKDAKRKAIVLSLNSFVIWNFTYGKLFVRKGEEFVEAKVWNKTNYITTREKVKHYKDDWIPIIHDIIMTVDGYFADGRLTFSPITSIISDNLMSEIIQRNKNCVSENLVAEISKSSILERKLNAWWKSYKEEFDKDELNQYTAYAKSILLNWVNRIMFANVIRRYHDCTNRIKDIKDEIIPKEANEIIDKIINEGDFYNVLHGIEYNDLIPTDTWIDIVDYNQFLVENRIDCIEQKTLQDILEKTVNTTKREIRGQYATPYILANFLVQITVENWHENCADFCAGTGTIAKAIINNKMRHLKSNEEIYSTTWVSDKYAYPLQIANIALTSIKALNQSLNLFELNVFDAYVGKVIHVKSPIDGADIDRSLPEFDTIVSNLPFVKYNQVGADEKGNIEKVHHEIAKNTNIRLTLGKADIYFYIPFKLHSLLRSGGKLGIITSNSWLGTTVGKQFFDALAFYYKIKSIVLSNAGRWFNNADVVTTLLILEKKDISIPATDELINFCLLNNDIHELNENQMDDAIGAIVLADNKLTDVVSIQRYSYSNINKICEYGITLNTLFHDVSWELEMQDALIPVKAIFEVKRGERRGWNDLFYPKSINEIEAEYIKPVLKKPGNLTSYMANTDALAFCCHRSIDELERVGHNGALTWIRRFEHVKNGSGRELPVALRRSSGEWYEMDDTTKADFVTALNPDKRIFVSRFKERTFVDQRFTRLLIKDKSESPELLHALLNSLYGIFAIEAIGFGRGLGVLDASSTKLKNMYMINPNRISSRDKKEILELFECIKNRPVMDIIHELNDQCRENFDRRVLKSVGHEQLYNKIRESLLSIQYTRETAKR